MIFRFLMVSGIGWLIDFSLFFLLITVGLSPLLANAIGATVAVTFVFFRSAKVIFLYDGKYIFAKLLLYFCYQTFSIFLASCAVQGLTTWFGLYPVMAKCLVTPLTFYFNFQFMSFITTGKFRLR